METINIKFDEEQLEEIVKKVTEKLKDTKDNYYELSDTNHEEQKRYIRMYLEANETDDESKKEKIYFGYVHNTLSKVYSSQFDLSSESDFKKALELKNQGWKYEVIK